MNYMGIDIGTSGCKAVVFGETGRALGSASREYDVIFTEDGGAELDSDKVIELCEGVIREAADQAGEGSIKGLGISSQGEAFTAVGKGGRALSRAMISSDLRAQSQARTWPRQFGEEALYRITGHTAHPLFTLFKLLWLKENRRAVWDQAERFLCFEDLLHHRLGLDPAMAWSLAGRTMLFDVQRHVWSEEILSEIGLPASKLARPLPSGSMVGEVPGSAARRLGLADRAFVVAGGHDQPCGSLGAGVTAPGSAMYATGTVESICPAYPEPLFSETLRTNNLCTYDHAVPGLYTTVAYSLTGGNLLKWFRDKFGEREKAQAEKSGENTYALLLDSLEDRPSDLMVLPYFTPSGTPHFDTATRGAILGLRLSTGKAEVLKALLEGVAFEMKLNLDILERSGCSIDELRAIGGGAKSASWIQMKADVLGKPITIMNVTEGGCLGAALLACAADTGRAVQELAKEWVKPLKRHEPRQDRSGYYQERFAFYRKIYPALKALGWPDQPKPC